MDIMTQILAAADQINFDRIRVALLYASKSLQTAPTLLNQITYWDAHDNYLALSQIVPSREWQG